jgi:hypothetical protein
MTWMLLVAHFLALGVAVLVFLWMFLLHRRAMKPEGRASNSPQPSQLEPAYPQRPASWLAIRSINPSAVQAALDGHHFNISAPVGGWIIVTGEDLPTPTDDVDACHLFLTALSREVGHVQYFYAEKFSSHHAWARLDEGCVTRAFAWTGETVWLQGAKTVAESGLAMKSPGYGEDSDTESWATNESAVENVEKIQLLAARWGIDPAMVLRAGSISGESQQFGGG